VYRLTYNDDVVRRPPNRLRPAPFFVPAGENQIGGSVKMVRDAPSTASPAWTALPTAHFERNDITIIGETVH